MGHVVIPVGLEPTSPGLRVRCLTIRPENHVVGRVGLEPTCFNVTDLQSAAVAAVPPADMVGVV